MKGLDIAEQYYLKVGKPLIENKYSDYKDRTARVLRAARSVPASGSE